MVVLIMGVSGAGKTTIGRRLADVLGWPFHDGDDYHPPANVAKMRAGLALTDDDRAPWLEALGDLIAGIDGRGDSAVVAASVLSRAHRARVLRRTERLRLVYLRATPSLIRARLEARTDHFMPTALLESQFAALEEPAQALAVDAARPADEIVGVIRRALEP